MMFIQELSLCYFGELDLVNSNPEYSCCWLVSTKLFPWVRMLNADLGSNKIEQWHICRTTIRQIVHVEELSGESSLVQWTVM